MLFWIALEAFRSLNFCHIIFYIDFTKQAAPDFVSSFWFRGLLGTNDPAEESAARLLEQIQKG